MTNVEPGGARAEFRYGSAQVADLMEVYHGTPAHASLAMLDPANEARARRPLSDGCPHHRVG